MLNIKGYDLQSFSVGAKYVRAFSFDSSSGTIVDYVLAECGADKSPFPDGYYRRVSFGDGIVRLHNVEDTASYVVSRDNTVISERTESSATRLGETGEIIGRAKHLIPNTLAFMNHPKAKLLGMVWQFTENNRPERERFKHPVAEKMAKNLVKLELKSNESPAETSIHLAFRKKMSGSYLLQGQNDFLNVILSIGDVPVNDVWPDTDDTKPRTAIKDDVRVASISIDIQIFFDPRRKVSEKTIDAHWEECQGMRQRLSELLRGVGFEAE